MTTEYPGGADDRDRPLTQRRDMRYCPWCGAAVGARQLYCASCGRALSPEPKPSFTRRVGDAGKATAYWILAGLLGALTLVWIINDYKAQYEWVRDIIRGGDDAETAECRGIREWQERTTQLESKTATIIGEISYQPENLEEFEAEVRSVVADITAVANEQRNSNPPPAAVRLNGLYVTGIEQTIESLEAYGRLDKREGDALGARSDQTFELAKAEGVKVGERCDLRESERVPIAVARLVVPSPTVIAQLARSSPTASSDPCAGYDDWTFDFNRQLLTLMNHLAGTPESTRGLSDAARATHRAQSRIDNQAKVQTLITWLERNPGPPAAAEFRQLIIEQMKIQQRLLALPSIEEYERIESEEFVPVARKADDARRKAIDTCFT